MIRLRLSLGAVSLAALSASLAPSRALAQAPDATGSCDTSIPGNCDSSPAPSPTYDYTPPAPDPEAEARAQREREAREEAERKRLQEAEDEYDAAVQRALDRAARGRDIPAAYAALVAALERGKGHVDAREALAPIPKRGRTPIAAKDQAGCAAFHATLAVSMEVWANRTLPMADASFVDGERAAHEAGSVFDRGESIAGCDALTVVPIAASGGGVSADPKADAATILRLVPDLEAAAEAVRAARAAYDGAHAEYEQAKRDREAADAARAEEKANLEKDLEVRRKTERDDTDVKKRKERSVADAKALAWKLAKEEQHQKFLDLLAERDAADAAAKKAHDDLDAATAAAKARGDAMAKEAKAQADKEAELAKKDADAKKKLDEEEKKRAEAEARGRDAAADLEKQAGDKPRPARVYRAAPRAVGHRGPR